jgi:hypothetical protein
MAKNIQKAPGEIEDFTIDWSTRGLGSDTIDTSNWDVKPAGLSTISPSPSKTNTTTTVWLSGGMSGVNYTITNTIVTAGGRTLQQQVNCFIYP